MKIFLIGFMGCGKSTIGRQIAKKLALEFIDMDDFIENSEQLSIPDIFSSYGEQYFRNKEKDALVEISKKENIVVATGGGTPIHFDNMDYMNRCGTTIYLKMDGSTLVNRVMNSHIQRPLLMGKSRDEMLEVVGEMLLTREPVYEKAMIIINGKDIKTNDVLEEIKKW